MTLASHKRIQPLYDGWIRYLNHRLPGETPHADDYFPPGGAPASASSGTAVTASGTAIWLEGRNRLSVAFDNQSTSDLAVYLWPLTPNTTPVTVETAFSIFGLQQDFVIAGVCLTDGTATTSNIAMGRYTQGLGGGSRYRTSAGTITNFFVDVNNQLQALDIMLAPPQAFVYMRVVWTAANSFAISLSGDGVTWHAFDGTATFTKTMTPTHYGVLVSTNTGTVVKSAAFEYVRVYQTNLS